MPNILRYTNNDLNLTESNLLHVVDLDGAVNGTSNNTEVIKDLIINTNMDIQVGGGIRKIKDVENLLRAGADKVAINSASINNPEFIARCVDKFGSQCIVSSVDCRAKEGT